MSEQTHIKQMKRLTRQVFPPGADPDEVGWEQILELRKAQENGSTKPVVVCVHGTFAAAEDRKGAGWWQTDGQLAQKLGETGEIDTIQFHWSGRNSESCRILAGIRLWIFLNQIEELEVPFSVVAHSHGGSVLFNALVFDEIWHEQASSSDGTDSALNGADYVKSLRRLPVLTPAGVPIAIPRSGDEDYKGFPRLQRWITVGTPFFGLSMQAKPNVVLSTVISLFLGLLPVVALAFHSQSQSPWPIVYGSSAALILLSAVGLSIATFLRSRRKLYNSVVDAKPTAWKTFKSRFTAIWSRSDESILGFKAGVATHGRIVPRFVIGKSGRKKLGPRIRRWNALDADFSKAGPWARGWQRLSQWVFSTIQKVGLWLSDVLILPLVDRVLRSRARRLGFGIDFSRVKCVGVSVCPNGDDDEYFPSVEETITDCDLGEFVTQKSPQIIDEARTRLWESQLAGVASFFSSEADDVHERNEDETGTTVSVLDHLVHNNYFKHPRIVGVICEAIGLHGLRRME